MKVLRSSVFRAICSIIIGVLLIQYPDGTVTWITVAIGVLFLLSGVLSCATYLNALRNVSTYKITDVDGNLISPGKPTLPVVGIGSVILGVMLVINPSMFVAGLMYILGAMLILGTINQYMGLLVARRYGHLAFGYWICPSLVLLTGLYVIVKPMDSAAMPLIIIGWCSLLYGITEIVNAVKIYSWKKRLVSSDHLVDKDDIVQ